MPARLVLPWYGTNGGWLRTSITAQYVEAGTGVVLAATGSVAEGALAGCAVAFLRTHRDDVRPAYVLVDFADVTEFRISRRELFALAFDERLLATVQPGAAVAVAASQAHVFGLAKVWQGLVAHANLRVEVFRDRAAAGEWLGAVRHEARDPETQGVASSSSGGPPPMRVGRAATRR